MNQSIVFWVGIALIATGITAWIWRGFSSPSLAPNDTNIEEFGIKFGVKNDALAIIILGIVLIWLSSSGAERLLNKATQSSEANEQPAMGIRAPLRQKTMNVSEPTQVISNPRQSEFFIQFETFVADANARNAKKILAETLRGRNVSGLKIVTYEDYREFPLGWHAVVLGPYATNGDVNAALESVLPCTKSSDKPVVRKISVPPEK